MRFPALIIDAIWACEQGQADNNPQATVRIVFFVTAKFKRGIRSKAIRQVICRFRAERFLIFSFLKGKSLI